MSGGVEATVGAAVGGGEASTIATETGVGVGVGAKVATGGKVSG